MMQTASLVCGRQIIKKKKKLLIQHYNWFADSACNLTAHEIYYRRWSLYGAHNEVWTEVVSFRMNDWSGLITEVVSLGRSK